MALFAKILWRGAVDKDSATQFIALVGIVKKKGGTPFRFVLGRHTISYDEPGKAKIEMIRIKAALIEKYIKRFWPQGLKEGSAFIDCESSLWQKTNSWLYAVVVRSWWHTCAEKKYVRVCNPRKKRKKPFRSKEERKQISLIQEARVREELYLRKLKNELPILQRRLRSLEDLKVVPGHVFVSRENSAEYTALRREIANLNSTIACATQERPKINPASLRPIGRIFGGVRRVLA